MDLSPPQLTFHRLRGQLRSAADATFNACVQLTAFTETTALFTEIEASSGDTGQALAERHRAVAAILAAITTQSQQLQAEYELFGAAWNAHQAAMANELHPRPVSNDDRIARALAERFNDVEGPEDLQELYDLLDDLGLEPAGPDWARWGLDVWGDKLHWVAFVPTEHQMPPAPPISIASDDAAADDPPPASAPPAVPAEAVATGEDRA